jgi:hypothetical protein
VSDDDPDRQPATPVAMPRCAFCMHSVGMARNFGAGSFLWCLKHLTVVSVPCSDFIYEPGAAG